VLCTTRTQKAEHTKSQDLNDLCKAAELMDSKAHLTLSGMDEIRKIKAGKNRG
jgi:hypothetical protein